MPMVLEGTLQPYVIDNPVAVLVITSYISKGICVGCIITNCLHAHVSIQIFKSRLLFFSSMHDVVSILHKGTQCFLHLIMHNS